MTGTGILPAAAGVTSQSAALRRLPAPLKGSRFASLSGTAEGGGEDGPFLLASPLGEGDREAVERSIRCGGDGGLDGSVSRCGATPFLLAEKKWGKETAKGDLVGAHVARSVSAGP